MTEELPDTSKLPRNGQEEPRFLDYVSILVRWWKFIVINFLLVTGIAVGISFILPKWYKATASILPPKDTGLLNLMGAANPVLRGLGSLSRLSGLGQTSSSYNYFAILKSRTVMEDVVRKFDLVSVYDVSDSSMEKAVKELKDNSAFESQEDDNITVEVYDKDPVRAAGIANYFVELLNARSIELGTQEARSNREFIETRVNETKANLRSSEESLKKFQEQKGMLITPEQSSSISAVAELYAMKARKEIELAIVEKRLSTDNEVYRQGRIELNELDKKLAAIPQAGLETFRLYREVVTNQKILEFLIPIYEQAKINEHKDVPVLLVLDRAVPPERKSRPQRLLIVLLASTLSFAFLVAAVFAMHGIARREAGERKFHKVLQHRIRKLALAYHIDLS